MHIFLATLVMSLAGQVAEASRYVEATTPPPAAEPAAAAPQPTELPSDSPTTAGQPALPAQTQTGESSAEPAAGSPPAEAAPSEAKPLATAPEQPPAGWRAGGVAPQRSVLAESGPKPSDFIRSLLKAPSSSELAGRPLSLSDAVREARSRQDQTARAKAYWDLSAAVADYHLALLESTELAVLRQGVSSPGKVWDARHAESQIRIASTRHAAQAAQLRLHQLLGRDAASALPLPGDAPHCGRYNTEYDEIFASRPNAIARQLSELMPLRYDDLRSQAKAVAEAVEARSLASQRRDPASDGSELLQAQDLLSLRRRSLVATARDYNQEIAAYTELAAPAEVAPDRLVAMMIRTSAESGRAPWTPSGVERASAEAPAEATPATHSEIARQQQTFAPDQYNAYHPGPLRRLLPREREHSIVSAIRRLRDRP